jgi:hypothetical protein
MLAKLSEADAAWIAADRAAFTAESLHEPLAVSASLFRMAHVFLSLGHIAQAQTVAETAVNALEDRADALSSPEALSLCGAFHLVLAVVAARDNDRQAANDHLAADGSASLDVTRPRDLLGGALLQSGGWGGQRAATRTDHGQFRGCLRRVRDRRL